MAKAIFTKTFNAKPGSSVAGKLIQATEEGARQAGIKILLHGHVTWPPEHPLDYDTRHRRRPTKRA